MKRLVVYRFLSGEDNAAFCHKVTAALDRGWQLYGNPTYAYDQRSGAMRCGQAVVKEVDQNYDPDLKLGEL